MVGEADECGCGCGCGCECGHGCFSSAVAAKVCELVSTWSLDGCVLGFSLGFVPALVLDGMR